MGRSWKREIDTVKEYLKNRGLDVREARRMVHDRSVWPGFVRGNAWVVPAGYKPLTLTRCHRCELSQLYEALEGWKSFLCPSPQLKDIKGKCSFFISFSFTKILLSFFFVDARRPRGSGILVFV